MIKIIIIVGIEVVQISGLRLAGQRLGLGEVSSSERLVTIIGGNCYEQSINRALG